jgi:hypothetical protein
MTVPDELMETMLQNSYRNFHAKGFDYLCLKRTPELTLKAYFFDGDVSKLPEVVMPHDHRYAFQTCCLAGKVLDRTYHPSSSALGRLNVEAQPYDMFHYETPLNGGDGFTWIGVEWLACRWHDQIQRTPGGSYRHDHWDIHTIQIAEEQTVLLLAQFADEVPIGKPTRAYRNARGDTSRQVSLDGLYDEMDADHAVMRLGQVRALLGDCDSREMLNG